MDMLELAAELVKGMSFNYERTEKNSEDDMLRAPILVKRLVGQGMDPNIAKESVSKFMAYLKRDKQRIIGLTSAKIKEFFPTAPKDFMKDLYTLKLLTPFDNRALLDSLKKSVAVAQTGLDEDAKKSLGSELTEGVGKEQRLFAEKLYGIKFS
jgi:argininosuccinate lyase